MTSVLIFQIQLDSKYIKYIICGRSEFEVASRIEDKDNAILPLGGAHYLMKLYKINEAIGVGAYNTKVDLYNGRTSDDGLRIARTDGSFCYTSECLKNTWGYYIQSRMLHNLNSVFLYALVHRNYLAFCTPFRLLYLFWQYCSALVFVITEAINFLAVRVVSAILHHEFYGWDYTAQFWSCSISLNFTADARLSLGRSGDKTFAALNPLLC